MQQRERGDRQHARASTPRRPPNSSQLAAQFQCDVSLARKARRVNGKSLMGVMMLAAGQGSRIVLETDGPDEVEALNAITALVADRFGEAL